MKKLVNFLFFLILYEVSLGGGGRFIEFHGVTLRMGLFICGLLIFVLNFLFFGTYLSKSVFFLVCYFTFVLYTGIFVAFLNETSYLLIFEDIKPLIFFYIILFFSIKINDQSVLNKIIFTFKSSAIILALMYYSLLVLLYLNKLDFEEFYLKQNDLGEISFRDGFFLFYKGFIFLCIGYVFFLTTDFNRYKILYLFILFFTIVISFTRGFLLFTLVITLIHYLFKNLTLIKGFFIFFVIFFFSWTIIYFNLYEFLFGDKSTSDSIRLDTILEVYNNIDLMTFFIGHGFGNGVMTRPGHMEISFLEIFHKQGLLGLSFWIILFGYIFVNYNKIKDAKSKKVIYPFYLGTIFILMQSFTNPYMNNPIGLSFIVLSFVIIDKVSSKKLIVK